jgi:hypothetical protein
MLRSDLRIGLMQAEPAIRQAPDVPAKDFPAKHAKYR